MSEEKIVEEEFNQEEQEKSAWAIRGWDFEEEPEIDPEVEADIEELVNKMIKEKEDGD